MAEILVRVRDATTPNGAKDGDIICASSDLRIKHVHADAICSSSIAGFNQHGLRDPLTLIDSYLQNTSTYKFQRTDETVVDRVLLADGTTEEISSQPNDRGEYMDVPLFILRRLNHARHLIFGTPGSEYWYGGRQIINHAALDKVWHKIETDTPEREVDYRAFPLTDAEKRGWFAMTVDDGDEPDFDGLIEPLLDIDGNAIKKRKHFVVWQDLVTAPMQEEILDRTCEHDHRDLDNYVRETVVRTKTE